MVVQLHSGLQVSGEKEFFANMVVDAVSHLDPDSLDMSLLGTKKVQGGGLRDSFLVDGVAFKKTFSYAGFEMQKKSYSNPRILALNIELELKSEKENAEVTLWTSARLGEDSDGIECTCGPCFPCSASSYLASGQAVQPASALDRQIHHSRTALMTQKPALSQSCSG